VRVKENPAETDRSGMGNNGMNSDERERVGNGFGFSLYSFVKSPFSVLLSIKTHL